MKRSIVIPIMLVLSSFGYNVEELRKVTGTVYDESNQPLPGVSIIIKGTYKGTMTDFEGKYEIEASNSDLLVFSFVGYLAQEIKIKNEAEINVVLKPDVQALEEVMVIGYGVQKKISRFSKSAERANATGAVMRSTSYDVLFDEDISSDFNTEEYDHISENIFKIAKSTPLSTLSIDVDAASYANVRRMLENGQKPYADAVRIEEMINYFSYDYENPTGEHPFSINSEVSTAPWNPEHQLVHVGIQGKKLDTETRVSSNLVFLIDVSGSMSASNKLPLLKSSMKLLVNNLSANDRIAIVAYAGAAGLVLPSTPAADKETIFKALERLNAGGSTAGGAGIKLAYKVAEEHLIKDGNNRVILATDGDFNTGVSSTSEMVRLIEDKRKSGIYLTITGFGMGNYKDGRMEQISNAGNGNYYYIDSYKEANKVFGQEMQSTLFTIAKDVKIQIEFNPNIVQAYRLIGYENRKLNAEDFNDDKVDAGELGAGHTVTALYEIIPVGVKSSFVKEVNELKYQASTTAHQTTELMTVNIRYKPIDSNKSILLTKAIQNQTSEMASTSDNFRFSASVAQFGMILRNSAFKQGSSLYSTLSLAKGAKGKDEMGYRQEYVDLVRNYAAIVGERLN